MRYTLLNEVKSKEGLLVHQKKNEYLSSIIQGIILYIRLTQNLEDRWCYGDLDTWFNFFLINDSNPNKSLDDTKIRCWNEMFDIIRCTKWRVYQMEVYL